MTIQNNPAKPYYTRLSAGDELAGLYERKGKTRKRSGPTKPRWRPSSRRGRNSSTKTRGCPSPPTPRASTTTTFICWWQQGRSDEALAAADQSRARTLAQGLGVAEGKASSARGSESPPDRPKDRRNAALLLAGREAVLPLGDYSGEDCC